MLNAAAAAAAGLALPDFAEAPQSKDPNPNPNLSPNLNPNPNPNPNLLSTLAKPGVAEQEPLRACRRRAAGGAGGSARRRAHCRRRGGPSAAHSLHHGRGARARGRGG